MNLELWVVKIESGTGRYMAYETTLKAILVDLTIQGRFDAKTLTAKICANALEDYKDFYQCEVFFSPNEARAFVDKPNWESIREKLLEFVRTTEEERIDACIQDRINEFKI